MRHRGFTLIEAILALAILSVGLLGLLYVFQVAAKASGLADQTYIAENLAQEAAEKIIASRDNSLSGGGYASTLSAIQAGSFNQNPVSGFPSYSLTVTAFEADAEGSSLPTNFTVAMPNSGYARVTVRVTFNGGANYIQLVTIIASYT